MSPWEAASAKLIKYKCKLCDVKVVSYPLLILGFLIDNNSLSKVRFFTLRYVLMFVVET